MFVMVFVAKSGSNIEPVKTSPSKKERVFFRLQAAQFHGERHRSAGR
jgi:hypothetical protein